MMVGRKNNQTDKQLCQFESMYHILCSFITQEYQPDIFCVQESFRGQQNKFERKVPDYGHSVFSNGCSIISKFKMTQSLQRKER